MILKKKIVLDDLESVDAELYRGLQWMLCVSFSNFRRFAVLLLPSSNMLTPRPFASSLSLSSDNDITDVIENTFTTEEERFGEIITIPLVPGGEDIEVTQENKREYVEAITEYRIAKRVEEQQLALQAGLNEVIPQDLLNVFDERELELLIGGMADIDIDDWKKHTDYVRSLF